MEEVKNSLFEDLEIDNLNERIALKAMVVGETRYLKDLRINIKNALKTDYMSEKEALLMAFAIAINEKNEILADIFGRKAEKAGAEEAEIAEAAACSSLLASNNVLYRFRHFADKDEYENEPARIKMNIMMKPVIGKEFFELISLAVSAVNGCERCVKAHEDSLLKMGSNTKRIFESIRLASVITSLGKVIY
ncbi:carboxymuconolactone decarboxylase family protein [Marinigracilibium pacificum]|uniref:Alkyl hydroperoxide reductase AhpD n=1 Tax=Marinigracilibium pacificum TaxID=2729599 RepID=A0A848IZZ2_9BACT|nr:carboxymuconolactone decarboxylase family protein [Marinigracilibium pacificum]NMM48961.1 alkylhydroperoxidase [Marinigracilibium pacificum]